MDFKRLVEGECKDGNMEVLTKSVTYTTLHCHCGNTFNMKQGSMKNAAYDDHGRIVAQCPACSCLHVPEEESEPRVAQVALYLTMKVIAEDRKSMKSERVVAAIGRTHDMVGWGMKMVAIITERMPEQQIEGFEVTLISDEEFTRIVKERADRAKSALSGLISSLFS